MSEKFKLIASVYLFFIKDDQFYFYEDKTLVTKTATTAW